MSLTHMFTALCLGGSLYLVPRKLRADARAISELIYAQQITYTFTCSSGLRGSSMETLDFSHALRGEAQSLEANQGWISSSKSLQT
jgi:hypothetical protein